MASSLAPPSRVRVERVLTPSRAVTILVPIASILVALILGGVLILANGENPVAVYGAMLKGAFGSPNAIAETLVKTTPLLLAGLGVAVAFQMQLWNIGAEGQLYMGAVAATGVALFLVPDWPGPAIIAAMVVGGLVGGGAWGFIPGWLRAYLGANEIITSLMLNYVAILFAEYLIHGPWRDPAAFGFPGTPRLPDAASLPNWEGTRVHLGLVFGLVAAVALWFLLRRTRWGYEISVTGENPRAARYAGMPIKRTIVMVMVLSGALAGLAGMSEIAGIGHQLQRNFSPGYGYTAIIVAWMGRLHPAGIVLVAVLLAGLLVGGDQIQMTMGLPSAIAPMLQGIILFCVLGGEILTRYRFRWSSSAPPAPPTTSVASQDANHG